MALHPLNCSIQSIAEHNYACLEIGIDQLDMLYAYFLFDALLSGHVGQILLQDRRHGQRCLFVRASGASQRSGDLFALCANDVECIKKLLFDCLQSSYNAAWEHIDLFIGGTDIKIRIL